MVVEKCAKEASSLASTFLLCLHIHQRKETLMGPEPCNSVTSNLTAWYTLVRTLHLEAGTWVVEVL